MSIDREAIHTAVFEQLRTISDLVTVERVLRHIDDVQPEEMPYAAMVMKNQQVVRDQAHLPKKYMIPVEVYVYVTSKDQETLPAPQINRILDAIDRAFEPPMVGAYPETVTLGVPKVIDIRVTGDIVTDEGTLGAFAAAVVPIMIIAAG